jgi:hypothetical protein
MQDPASELRRTPSRRSSEYAPLRSSGPSGEEISKATHTPSKFIGDSSGLGTNRSSEHIRALPANFWNGQICKWASAADPCGSRDKYRAPPIDLTLVGVGYPYPSAPAERAPVYAYTEEKTEGVRRSARALSPPFHRSHYSLMHPMIVQTRTTYAPTDIPLQVYSYSGYTTGLHRVGYTAPL